MKMEQRGSLRFGMLSLLVLSLWFPLQGAVSGNEESAPAGTALVATPLLQVPPINAEALRLRDKRAKSGRRSKDLQFAEPFEANARHVDCGQWDVLENGLVRWTLLVHAPGATDVNIGFTDVVLPEGCSLRIMTADEGFSVGPYSQADMTANRQLWTPVLPGDFIMIEATMPAQARSGFALTVSRVNSGYLDLMNWLDNAAKGARKAQGLCNIDVVCPETAGWANPIRSVGRYTINGTGLCTGTLLMNQRADFRPFFLTANHCISASGDAASVVVYWNYQSPTCGNLSGGSLAQYQSGASLRATHEATDFTLLELSTNPGASFNVHYAGWDRSNTASAGAVGIHHPDGREKAWSKETHTLSSTDAYYETVNASAGYWRVLHWELGTTEPGSSGSGLWSLAGKRVVGQLLGGDSACNGVDSNFQSDWYGKLYTSWTGGGTAATRLRDWLDPDNTGLTGMDGLNPSSSSITIWPASRIHTTSAAASGQKIAVTSTVPWTATRSANWITITGGASGSGNGTVTYNISTNSGLVRYGYITVTGGGVSRRFHINQNTAKVIVANDFDGDGKSDLGYYRPTGGLWSFRLSGGGTRTNEFGYVGTIPITGDFDGDEITDFGCYDAATGKWYIMPSKSPFRQASFGYQGTIPIVGDFDGDGKADFGCYDPSGIPGHAAPASAIPEPCRSLAISMATGLPISVAMMRRVFQDMPHPAPGTSCQAVVHSVRQRSDMSVRYRLWATSMAIARRISVAMMPPEYQA